MTKRKLKIQRKYSYTKAVRNYPNVNPSITLAGNWLRQAGFSSGQDITIEVHNRMLIITL